MALHKVFYLSHSISLKEAILLSTFLQMKKMARGTQLISGILTQIRVMPKAIALNHELEKNTGMTELSLLYTEM